MCARQMYAFLALNLCLVKFVLGYDFLALEMELFKCVQGYVYAKWSVCRLQ